MEIDLQTTEIDTVVVGAGPAGLATGACLQRVGVPFAILDRADSVASSWRSHYARLHLHTAKRHSSLPYRPFPKEAPQYPSREQVVAYLDAYREAFDLPVHTGEAVTSVRREADAWTTGSTTGAWRSRNLVVATGYNRVPVRPTWPGESEFRGRVLHSSSYRDGEPFRGQNVLVVGVGNTGGEIAVDLCEHGARPGISVRNPLWIMPRDLMGRPVQESAIALSRLPLPVRDAVGRTVSRVVFGDVARLGFRKPAEGPMTQIVKRGRIPLIDVGTLALIRAGKVTVEPEIERFAAAGVRFTSGEEKPYDAIVLATGFTSGLEAFLEDRATALDERGYPIASASTLLPGLYFVGFRNVPTGLLREIGFEARAAAAAIARSYVLR
jgi:indole-3-pyruvate monooxygenase